MEKKLNIIPMLTILGIKINDLIIHKTIDVILKMTPYGKSASK